MPAINATHPVLEHSHFMTSPFGTRNDPVSGVKKQHNGVDLVARINGSNSTDFIVSFCDGKVIDSGYDDTRGYFIQIRNGDYTFLYQHMSAQSKLRFGATVKRGDRLGYMGNTGKSTGAHLHFEMKIDGKYVDPQPYLEGRKDMEKEQFAQLSNEEKVARQKQPASEYAKEAIKWCKERGITDATMPKDYCTREQVCTMIYRAVQEFKGGAKK